MFISFESYCIDFIHVQVIQCTMIKCHIWMLWSMLNFNHFFDSFLRNFLLYSAKTCTTSICTIPLLISNRTDCQSAYYGILLYIINSASNINQKNVWNTFFGSVNQYDFMKTTGIIQMLLKPPQYIRLSN